VVKDVQHIESGGVSEFPGDFDSCIVIMTIRDVDSIPSIAISTFADQHELRIFVNRQSLPNELRPLM